MKEVLQALASFFAYAVMAVFAQNAVFTRALGVSRVVKLVDDGTVDTVMFGSLLCAVQLISAPLGKILILHRRLALRWAAVLAMCWPSWW